MENKYDIVIVGSGPLGASTAYHLAGKNKSIALISREPSEEDSLHKATYLYSGGSIRWFFDDPEIARNTKKTADFIREKVNDGVDFSVIEDSYVFVHRGLTVPSLNVSGAKLIKYFVEEAQKKGVIRHEGATMQSFSKQDNEYIIETNKGKIVANKLLLAIGPGLKKFLPEAEFEFEKRQVFILDLSISPEREKFPHLIFPFNGGMVYIFIKKVGDKFKMLLSQENVIEENGQPGPQDYFKELCDLGLTEWLPFLKDTKTEQVLWGFDAKNKNLKIYSPDNQLFAATCGSAIRGSIGLGQELASILNPE